MNVVAFHGQDHSSAKKALRLAYETRLKFGQTLENPICCYDLCEALGITVRFVGINMEGVYLPGPQPRICLSALRPLARRHFTCAHELGHHLFGHGAKLDELKSDQNNRHARHPNEVSADIFAGHLLMPAIAMKREFRIRHSSPEEADALCIHSIASGFGIGYETVLTHLAFSLRYISPSRRNELVKDGRRLRKELSNEVSGGNVVLLDGASTLNQVSLETGQCLVAPLGSSVEGPQLMRIDDTPHGTAFNVNAAGQTQLSIPQLNTPISVRVAPYQFVGLAKYRYLEDVDEQRTS